MTRIIRIYQQGHFHLQQELRLSEAAGQHVGIVLRKKIGDRLVVFSGDNREWDAEIISAHKKKVTVCLLTERLLSRESPRIIRLAQAISKGERMEWLIQKAVELGVHAIYPIVTQHAAYKMDEARLDKKFEQWQAIAISACEQCGRNQIPLIARAQMLSEYLESSFLGAPNVNYVLDPYSGKSLRSFDAPPAEISLMIGPEGGFHDIEISALQDRDFRSLSLGPRILRTETAAMTALGVVQAAWGDL